MDTVLYLIVFIVILLIYMHVIKHYELSFERSIDTIEFSKEQIKECCKKKQVVIFDNIMEIVIFDNILENDSDIWKGSHDFYLKSSEEHFLQYPLYMKYTIVENLMQNSSKYFSENNHSVAHEILSDSCMDKELRPELCVNTIYDILLGSQNTRTFFNYHKHHSMFLFVQSGKIRLYIKYSNNKNIAKCESNYYDMTYGSVNKLSYDQQVLINENQVCFIPPFLLYQIEYIENTTIMSYSYNDLGSFVSQIPDIGLYYIHRFSHSQKKSINTKRNVVIEESDVGIEKESKDVNENLEVIEKNDEM